MTDLIRPTDAPGFRAWLSACLDIPDPEISDVSAPTGGGWSSETWLMTIRDRARAAAPFRAVLRLAPAGIAMFPQYDLARQVTCLRVLQDVPNCPVPRLLAEDPEGRSLGRPLYLMAFVPGQVPADDRPTLFEAGFLFDANPAEQRRFYVGLLSALVGLHDVEAPRSLARREPGATALAREVAWLRGVFEWGRGPAPQAEITRALDHLEATLPIDRSEVMLWGDARPANVIVRDFAPVALLDWELASLGPRELDVFWLLEMNRMRSRGRSLPGFLSDAETIAAYEAATGHPLKDHDWHTLFAATKVAILMLRHLLVRVAAGDMPSDHPVITQNVATRRLAELLASTGVGASS